MMCLNSRVMNLWLSSKDYVSVVMWKMGKWRAGSGKSLCLWNQIMKNKDFKKDFKNNLVEMKKEIGMGRPHALIYM